MATEAPAPSQTEAGFISLFDGQSLDGWRLLDNDRFLNQPDDGYRVTNGVLATVKGKKSRLVTKREYDDFILRFEVKLTPGANNGIGIRAPLEGDAAYQGMEIQILDEGKPRNYKPEQYHGSIYGVAAAQRGALRPPGEWNAHEITANGPHIKVVVNGVTVLETNLSSIQDSALLTKHPGLLRERGHIALLGHRDYVEFRNLRLRHIPSARKPAAVAAPVEPPARVQERTGLPTQHVIVAAEPGKFLGWPVMNGLWSWDGGREFLVGLTSGDFAELKNHNIKPPYRSLLARSTDGGHNWTVWDPEGFVGDGGQPVPSPGGIAFDAPGFALRVVGTGYHGSEDAQGSFFHSQDRGQSWQGPFRFNGLMEAPELKDKGRDRECTARTSYLVTGRDSCLLFMSARRGQYRDRSFVAETTDGGKTFRFVSWMVPVDDPYRAVMPAVVRLPDGVMVATLRRRHPTDKARPCWVDCYQSADNGRTWTFLSKVDETGMENGNPAGLTLLNDGRLACVYGDRAVHKKLFLRLSGDGGRTWGDALVLRDDFQTDRFGDSDFGYPCIAQNPRGELVTIYYWAAREHFHQHIAATLLPLAAVSSGAPASGAARR